MQGLDCKRNSITPCRLDGFFFFLYLGVHLQLMEVPRLGVKSELQLLTSATATAKPVPSHIFDLYHSSRQPQILNPLSEPRDRSHILMDTSQVLNPLSHNRNSWKDVLISETCGPSILYTHLQIGWGGSPLPATPPQGSSDLPPPPSLL